MINSRLDNWISILKKKFSFHVTCYKKFFWYIICELSVELAACLSFEVISPTPHPHTRLSFPSRMVSVTVGKWTSPSEARSKILTKETSIPLPRYCYFRVCQNHVTAKDTIQPGLNSLTSSNTTGPRDQADSSEAHPRYESFCFQSTVLSMQHFAPGAQPTAAQQCRGACCTPALWRTFTNLQHKSRTFQSPVHST